MRVVGVVTACAALVLSTLAMTGSAAAEPTVSVAPSSGLAGGDVVQVTASGITPGSPVRINQCDFFFGAFEADCSDLTETVASATGTVSLPVTVRDPVFRTQEFGDPVPVLCRADVCRIFVVWDGDLGLQWVESQPLEFAGSPATIAASSSTDLRKKQRVRVSGTAVGAEGQTVRVLEQACFSIVQGSGCYGALPAVTTTVRADGSYSVRYFARRFLADGTDCAEPDILGFCQLNVVVLKPDGTPDDTFSVSRVGQPRVPLTFRNR